MNNFVKICLIGAIAVGVFRFSVAKLAVLNPVLIPLLIVVAVVACVGIYLVPNDKQNEPSNTSATKSSVLETGYPKCIPWVVIEVIVANAWIEFLLTRIKDHEIPLSRINFSKNLREYLIRMGSVPVDDGYYIRHADGFVRADYREFGSTYISLKPFKLARCAKPEVADSVVVLSEWQKAEENYELISADGRHIKVQVRHSAIITPPSQILVISKGVESAINAEG